MTKLLLFLFLLLGYIPEGGIAQRQSENIQRIGSTAKSDVFLQGFYWNSTPGGIWWDSLARIAPELASAGFGAVWIPAPTKGAAGALSMGYDIYDHFDFGEYNQKGSVKTRFGSRSELTAMISAFHSNGMQVFADAVMGHMNGGEQKTRYNCIPSGFPDSGWLVFNYPSGSGRFKKDPTYFYPNQQTCDANPPYHGPDPAFRFGEYLAHAQTKVKDSLIAWGKYVRKVLGFDGFRIDEAKGIDPIFMGPWLAQADSGGYAVAEDYDGISGIQNWLYWVQHFGGNCSMFDFPLRFDLKHMCDDSPGTWDMNWLDYSGLVNNGTSGYNVATFVDNHDFDRIGYDGSIDNPAAHNPIVNNKIMAYAYTIFSEGRPCVWFRDYYYYGLRGKIDTLIWIRQNFIWGGTTKRSGLNPWYVGSDDSQSIQSSYIYVARRNGGNGHPAVYIVINAHPTSWRGVWVNTDYPNQTFRDYTGVAMDKQAAADGRVDLWALPRGYAIYVPDTTQHVNFPPYIAGIEPQSAFINTPFSYQTSFGDKNNDSLQFFLVGNPGWLSITDSGTIVGTPSVDDVGSYSIAVKILDAHGDTASTSFQLTVYDHPLMDGKFDGSIMWGSAISTGDTLGWAGVRARELYVSIDSPYVYFGAKIRASSWMTWAFLINTKPGGSSSDSWGRSITYIHQNLPDYTLRGTFDGHAEFHTWSGSTWLGIGTPLSATEFGESITLDTLQDGWVEGRIPLSSIGNPRSLAVQFFITGNSNVYATFDACPNDQITTAWTGATTRLRYYAYAGTKALTDCNLQHPPNAAIAIGGTTQVYARTFGVGITDSSGMSSGVQAWIGYNSSNTNPAMWSSWIPASFNTDVGSYDEYRASIGPSLSEGVYYYASRFQYGGGSYIYGGYSASGGGFWNGTTNTSGVLSVFGPPGSPEASCPSNGAVNQPLFPTLCWTSIANAQTYRLQVAMDSTFYHIVYDDSLIVGSSRQIDLPTNDTTYYWHVRAQNVAGVSSYSAVWSFSVSQFTAYFQFARSWNMVSLPMIVSDRRKSVIFPTAASRAFRYEETGYIPSDTLTYGTGYWMKFSSADSLPITGSLLTLDTIHVQPGWNLFGSISTEVPIDAIVQLPRPLVRSEFYSYQSRYISSTIIQPSRAYWVKADTAGYLVLTTSSQAKHTSRFTIDDLLGRCNSLTIEDALHNQQTVYFGESVGEGIVPERFELPPIPPPGVFDVRFGSNRLVEVVDAKQVNVFPIQLSSGILYPITITVDLREPLTSTTLMIDGENKLLKNGDAVQVSSPSDKLSLIVAGAQSLPQSFALEQNYPNPFNPTTLIRYSLPTVERSGASLYGVTLRIYDVLGRVVATLVDEMKPPGEYTVRWDASEQSSGVYFYHIEASNASGGNTFRQVKKMIIIR